MSRLQGQMSRPMSRSPRVRCCRAGKARPMRKQRNRAGSQQGPSYRLRPALWTTNVTPNVTVSVTHRRDIVTPRKARPEGARGITPSRLVSDGGRNHLTGEQAMAAKPKKPKMPGMKPRKPC